MEKMRDVATRFRNIIERPEIKNGYRFFHEFPLGACRDASVLLGIYLKQLGFGEFYYTLAENAAGKTHSWLENEQFIIDITADQFPHISEKIILIEKRTPNQNHLGFVVSSRYPAALNILAGIFFASLINTYEAIKAEMVRP